MSAGAQIDYDALAAKHGATIDYDALAAKHGATAIDAGQQQQTQNRGFFGTLGDKFSGLADEFKKEWNAPAEPEPKTKEEMWRRNEKIRDEMADAPFAIGRQMKYQATRPVPADLNSPTYRTATTLSPLVPGLNPEAMEKASAKGDTGAVAAEAVVPTALAAAPLVGEGLVKGAGAVLPSAQRAGTAFQEVSKAIGTHPVQVTDELSKSLAQIRAASTTTNTAVPPVVRKLIDRLDPFQGGAPLTYDEARQFSSEIGSLSAADKMSLTPNTKRMISQLDHALTSTVQDTADLANKGEQLSGAMSEYHHAMQMRDLSDAVKARIIKTVLTGAGLYGLKKFWDAL